MTLLQTRSALTPGKRLDPGDWRSIVLMGIVVAALFASGVALLAAAVPGQFAIHGAGGPGVFGWATGVLAFALGVRHAFDVDHIAAIDNITRKLAAGGTRPLAVGFYFSLGHSTVVFVMSLVLGFGVSSLTAPLQDEASLLRRITGIVGPTISGVFLVVIAVVNITITITIVRVFRRLRAGEFDEGEFEAQLNKRGMLYRLFGGLADRIDRSWKMYPLGMMFGLGFDTATEIALLVLSGTAVLGGLPWWAVLSLPLLFAAGMCFFDTVDGVLMSLAYGWAFLAPARKVYYNVVITGMSALIALVIGLAQLGGVLVDNLDWPSPLVRWFESTDFLGYIIVGTLVAIWLVAVIVWRVGRFEEKYSEIST